MNKNKILTRAMPVKELSFDELYDSIATDWQKKAEKLRIRRWRQLKHRQI